MQSISIFCPLSFWCVIRPFIITHTNANIEKVTSGWLKLAWNTGIETMTLIQKSSLSYFLDTTIMIEQVSNSVIMRTHMN